MAEDAQAAVQQEQASGQEPDYKALYEQAKARSREWEKRAKANKSAADELARAQEAGKTAEERIAALTRRLDESERAQERAKTAAKVAAEKGVPADLLVGDDEESMAEWADRMREAFRASPAPAVPGAGSFDRGGSGASPERDFARALLGKD